MQFPVTNAVHSLRKQTLLHNRLEIFNSPQFKTLKFSSVSTATTVELLMHRLFFVVLTYMCAVRLANFGVAFISFIGYIAYAYGFFPAFENSMTILHRSNLSGTNWGKKKKHNCKKVGIQLYFI